MASRQPARSNVATKRDLREATGALRSEVKSDIDKATDALRSELKSDIREANDALRSELKSDMSRLESKLSADIRGVGVLVEQLGSQMTAFGEGLQATREGLERNMSDLEKRLGDRLSVVERVVRESSLEITALRTEVAEMRRQLDGRDGRLEDLERRMALVEKQLGIRP